MVCAHRVKPASSVCGTKPFERRERFALLSFLTSCSMNIFIGNVGYRWVALERCAEMVRADIAAPRWGSVFKERSGPKGHEGKDAHTDAMEKGDGKQSRKIIPVAAFWRGPQAASLQHLTLMKFEISSETAQVTQLYLWWGRRLCGMLWLS